MIIEEDVIDPSNAHRHDPAKLAAAIMRLQQEDRERAAAAPPATPGGDRLLNASVLLAGEVKGELARIQPARGCCRRAELLGLLHGSGGVACARSITRRRAPPCSSPARWASTWIRRAASPRRAWPASRRAASPGGGRIASARSATWHWVDAPACDRRSFLRGVLLGSGSISFRRSGPHVEFVLRNADAAGTLQDLLAAMGVRGLRTARRGHHVVYLKGHDEIVVAARPGRGQPRRARAGDAAGRKRRPRPAEPADQRRGGEPGAHGPRRRSPAAGDRSARARRQPGRACRRPSARRPRTGGACPTPTSIRLPRPSGVSRSAVNHRLRRLVELAERPGGLMRTPVDRRELEDEPADPRRGARARARSSRTPPRLPGGHDRRLPADDLAGRPASATRRGPALEVGAQTMHFEERGAFTGETSPLMLAGLASS